MRESKSRALTNLAIPQVPPENKHGSLSRTRTYDRSVNSRLLYQLSYQGIASNVDQSHFAFGTFSHATCFPLSFTLRVRFSDRSVAVNVSQSRFAYARALGTFSHTTCFPISFTLRVRFSDRSVTGNDLTSQAISSQVLSALACLTAVFGMGTGGSTQASSPDSSRAFLLSQN